MYDYLDEFFCTASLTNIPDLVSPSTKRFRQKFRIVSILSFISQYNFLFLLCKSSTLFLSKRMVLTAVSLSSTSLSTYTLTGTCFVSLLFLICMVPVISSDHLIVMAGNC